VLSNPTALPPSTSISSADPSTQADADNLTAAVPPVVRTGKGILNRRKLQAQAAVATAAQTAAAEAAALAASLEPQPERRPTRPVAQLRPMSGQDVVKILAACGSEITHLGKLQG
jgi:prophage DNA circulation protein